MQNRVYEPDAFEERVQYAKQCLLTGQTDSREFDTCFEMFDGDLVMVRLLQAAENDEPLRDRLEGYDLTWVRRKLYPLLKGVGSNEIESLAKTLRDRFQCDIKAMWPLLQSDD